MMDYDYIICGAGLAGLSLADRLTDSVFADKRILIVDQSAKDCDDRTWSFWSLPSFVRYKSVYRKTWDKLAFFAPDVSIVNSSAPYSYHTIRGIDFYNFVKQRIQACKHVDFMITTVHEISDRGTYAIVRTDEGDLRTDYAFDSIVRSFPTDNYLFVWQHFLGWEVEILEGSWDHSTATFMDFRMEQGDETRFVYVLPYSDTTALVEATVFSKDVWSEDRYHEMLTSYMDRYIGHEYRIIKKERGKIPMTTASFDSGSNRVIPIGTNNATVKPSSGYAFMRIQKECDQIVDGIQRGDLTKVKKSMRYKAYDRTLLNVLLTRKESAQRVFSLMFEHNNYELIYKFLDEETSLWEEVKIFYTLPFWSFLRAFLSENVFSATKSDAERKS